MQIETINPATLEPTGNPPLTITNKRAGLILRLLATLLDFFIFFTLVTFVLVPDMEKMSAFFFVEAALTALYEVIFRTTPGKQLLGMKIIYDNATPRAILTRLISKYIFAALVLLLSFPFTRKRQWIHDKFSRSRVVKKPYPFRFLWGVLYFIVGLNILATFGVGNLTWERIAQIETISLKRVDTLPGEITPGEPCSSENYFTVWNRGLRYRLPLKLNGTELKCNYRFHGYGFEPPSRKGVYGVRVVALSSRPHCDVCSQEDDSFMRLIKSCKKSPEEMQRLVNEVTVRDRFFVWNPLNMMQVQYRIMTKAMLLEGIGDEFAYRKVYKNGRAITWVYTKDLHTVLGHVCGTIRFDQIYLATETESRTLFIAWKGRKRDEQFVRDVIASLEICSPGPGDIEREIQLAKTHRSIPHALNAFRMTGKKYETGELLYYLHLEKGTEAEKRAFAHRISQCDEIDRRYLRLIYITRGWMAPPQYSEKTK
ncbi:MAG: RDD family protein [bacterium]|nr:RDD family protein [bacterium]